MSDTTSPAAATTTTTPTETVLAQMWRDLLGLTEVGPEDSFFDLGGTSLTAIKLLQRVETAFGEEALSPDDLYADPRLAAVAAAIDAGVKAG